MNRYPRSSQPRSISPNDNYPQSNEQRRGGRDRGRGRGNLSSGFCVSHAPANTNEFRHTQHKTYSSPPQGNVPTGFVAPQGSAGSRFSPMQGQPAFSTPGNQTSGFGPPQSNGFQRETPQSQGFSRPSNSAGGGFVPVQGASGGQQRQVGSGFGGRGQVSGTQGFGGFMPVQSGFSAVQQSTGGFGPASGGGNSAGFGPMQGNDGGFHSQKTSGFQGFSQQTQQPDMAVDSVSFAAPSGGFSLRPPVVSSSQPSSQGFGFTQAPASQQAPTRAVPLISQGQVKRQAAFSEDAELTAEEKEAYKKRCFHLGKIPVTPPSAALCALESSQLS